MAGVELKKVSKVYDNGFEAVKAIDLEIEDKEFMVLVGPSGCGKSTTLRMIAGLEELTSGELYIGDKLANDVDPKDRDIAMVFQNYALYPHMSVYQNMGFGLKLSKTPKEEMKERIEKAASILGLSDLLNNKPRQLSGGQRQRVALGRAIVRKPQVFLMDEPLSNLDAKLRVQTRAELIKLHQDLETTFVYVTHDQTEAMTMGSRICVMNEGLIQQVATPKEIYDNPKNLFVAGFIGSPQMNFIEGVLEEKEDQLYLRFTIDGKEYQEELQLSPENKEKVKVHIGEEVILGVRPEDTFPQEGGCPTKIVVSELLGSEYHVHFRLQEDLLSFKSTEEVQYVPEDEVDIRWDPHRIHLFLKSTEENLLYKE